MRVAILQSNYIPWRGYFDLMDDCDVFVVYDEVQYTKSDWRNRNKVKTRTGTAWMTVPVRRDGLATLIDAAAIDWSRDWITKHKQMIIENYSKAPYFESVAGLFFKELDQKHERLSSLNVALLKLMASELQIGTKIVDSKGLGEEGGKTDRLVSIVAAVGGTAYLSGPAAENYLDLGAFEKSGIAVEFKSYDYEPYDQLWGPFDGAVSVLDLMMNTGPEARRFLKSRIPNRSVVG